MGASASVTAFSGDGLQYVECLRLYRIGGPDTVDRCSLSGVDLGQSVTHTPVSTIAG